MNEKLKIVNEYLVGKKIYVALKGGCGVITYHKDKHPIPYFDFELYDYTVEESIEIQIQKLLANAKAMYKKIAAIVMTKEQYNQLEDNLRNSCKYSQFKTNYGINRFKPNFYGYPIVEGDKLAIAFTED